MYSGALRSLLVNSQFRANNVSLCFIS